MVSKIDLVSSHKITIMKVKQLLSNYKLPSDIYAVIIRKIFLSES